MAATEKTLAEKLIEAVGKKHPELLKHELVKELIEDICVGADLSIADINTKHKLDIRLGNGHIASIADYIGEAYKPVLEQAKKVSAEVDPETKEALYKTLNNAVFDASLTVTKKNTIMIAREFNLPESLKKGYEEILGIEAKELERAGFVSRLFREGEKLRPGRVGVAAAVGVAAVGGAAYLMTRKKEEPQAAAPAANWAAKAEAAKDNATERGIS